MSNHTRSSFLCLVAFYVGCGLDSELVEEEPNEPPLDQQAEAPGCAAASEGDHYEFLDDVCHRKRYPSNRDRALTCPTVATTASPTRSDGTVARYSPASAPVLVDDEALRGIVPDGLDVTVVLVRRVNGVPHYRYLSNGSHGDAFQPWSSTKFMAIANASARLRIASSYRVGLTASVDGVTLGDLATVIHNYDEQRYSSNGLARYFHNIGGRARANDLVHGWLQRPATESFGGNYGAAAPALGYTFLEPAGGSVTITPDTSQGPANRLSTLTLVEFLKRLVMHREDASTRMPGLQWADVATILYGAADSVWYPNNPGGMSADTAIYLQSAVSIAAIEQRSRGAWRIFSKLGFGDGEFVHVSYGCLPVLNAQGDPTPDVGKEVYIAVRLASGGIDERARDALLAGYYRAIVTRVVDGRLK
jgi:hypothetical protein